MKKRIEGTLMWCVQKATDWYRERAEESQGKHDFRCRIQGALLTALYLGFGENDEVPLKRLGEAISEQSRVSQSPIGHTPAILEYDDAWVGESIDDRLVFGKLYFASGPEPVALIYQIDCEPEKG